MLKENNNHVLIGKNLDEKYILLYQVWKELTERKTMDSYQYRIMNSLEALHELSSVIGCRLNGYYNSNKNIEDCRAETMEIISGDQIIKDNYPCVRNVLMNHLSKKVESNASLRALRYQIEYCYNILRNDYFLNLIDSLEQDIETNEENDKNESILTKANVVISNCVSMGWSTIALHNVIDILLGTEEQPEKWNIFKDRLIASSDERYCVYIPMELRVKVTGGRDKNTAMELVYQELIDMGIIVFTRSELLENNALADCANKITNERYIAVNVTAHDYYSASYKAIDKCSDILNIPMC